MIRFTLHLLLAIFMTAAFGYAISPFAAISPSEGAIQMLLIAGTGWGLQLLLAQIRLSPWKPYAFALGPVMSLGVMLLLPATLGFVFLEWSALWIPLISVACSFSAMLYLHHQSVLKLNLSPKWTQRWVYNLLSTAIAWIAIFYLIPFNQ